MRPSRLIVGFGAVLVAGLVAAAIAFILEERSEALRHAQRETKNLAIALAEETSRSFQSVDLIVRDLVEHIEQQRIATTRDFIDAMRSEAVHQRLRDRIAGVPQLGAVALIAADGTLVNLSRAWPVPTTNIEDRSFFTTLRDHPETGTLVSEPLTSHTTGALTIYVARRVNAPDGSFLGVAVGALQHAYFDRFYSQFALDSNSSIALLRQDGVLLTRFPRHPSMIGRRFAKSELLTAIETQPLVTLEKRSELDGALRIFSMRRLNDFPLLVTVTQSHDAVLADWHDEAIGVAATTLAAVLGIAIFIALLVRQVERRERSEAALAISEKRAAEKTAMLEATLENMGQGIAMADKDRRVLVYNRRLLEFLDLPEELLARKPIADEIVAYQRRTGEFDAEAAGADEAVRQWLETRRNLVEEQCYERRRPNGKVLEIRSVPLGDGAVVRTYTDVTERKRVEDELRGARDAADHAAKAKANFLATMSHEIRTPLNGVIGIIGLLRHTKLDADQSRMVDLVRESATSLLGVINDVLDLSKIEADAIAVVSEPTELRAFMRPLLEPLALAAQNKGLSLASTVAEDVPSWIMVDELRLRQILTNLVGNAVKFTCSGSVRLRVSCRPDETGGREICFVVEDTGIGMDEVVISRLFEPFVQADASTTRRFGGTGLGLSISRRLARLLGGEIRAKSTPGKGSIFELVLPLVEAPAPSGAEQSPTSPPPVEAFDADTGMRVLIAEDQPINRWLIQRQIKQLGLAVDLVADGDAALAELARRPYSLVITDLHMPEMDGIELARRIRQREADTGGTRVPIIALTADVTAEIAECSREAGMDDILMKPTDLHRLSEALHAHLEPPPGPGQPEEEHLEARPDVTFDAEIFASLFGGSETDGGKWLRRYMADADELMAALRQNVAERNAEQLATTAHRLCGSSLTVGAGPLGHICQDIERAARAADWQRIAELLDDAETAYLAAVAAIESFIARLERELPLAS